MKFITAYKIIIVKILTETLYGFKFFNIIKNIQNSTLFYCSTQTYKKYIQTLYKHSINISHIVRTTCIIHVYKHTHTRIRKGV